MNSGCTSPALLLRRPAAVVLLLALVTAQGQDLVPNGSFEDHTALPSDPSQWYHCTGWSSVNDYIGPYPYPFPYPGSPDYFHTQGTGNYIVPPNTFAGNVSAHTGAACMGLVTYDAPFLDEYREYLSATLTTPLTAGTSYTLRFWMTNGHNAVYNMASSGFGAAFSVGPLAQAVHEPLPVMPQFIQATPFWNTEWEEVTFTFTATAAYDHVTLGNFLTDGTILLEDMLPTPVDAGYVFIDDVSLTPNTAFQAAFTFTTEAACDSFLVQVTDQSPGATSWTWSFPGAQPASATAQQPPTLVYAAEGTHTITLIACEGNVCDTASLPVFAQFTAPPTVQLLPDTVLCEGDAFELSATTDGALAFAWSLDGVPLAGNTSTCTVDAPGTYRLTVSNAPGCTANASTVVSAAARPVVDLGPDAVLCSGSTIVVPAPSEGSFHWSNGAMSGPLTIQAPGAYWVQATNGCGTASDTVHVNEAPDVQVFVPDAFTPNGDGYNDAFAPVFSDVPKTAQWSIYDRWGELLFTGTAASDRWNGRFGADEAPVGVYVFDVTYQGMCTRPRTARGHVMLVR